jgi:hypothetical protein
MYIGLHAVWIVFYVLAGTMPNNRTKVNEPHKNWKPYSVTSESIQLLAQSSIPGANTRSKVFINGYFCSVVCIFLSVAFFDIVRMSPSPMTYPAPTPHSEPGVKIFCLRRFPPVYRAILSRYSRTLRVAAWTFTIVMTAMFCVGPVFVPYLALPLAQEVSFLPIDRGFIF